MLQAIEKGIAFGWNTSKVTKMCSLVNKLKKRDNLQNVVCLTGQHRQMLDRVLSAFGIIPDYDLFIMKEQQTLFDINTRILNRVKKYLRRNGRILYLFPWRHLHNICDCFSVFLYAYPCWGCRS